MVNIIGRKEKSKAEDTLAANTELANQYAKAIGKLGYGNYQQNMNYANQAQQNAREFEQQTAEAQRASNEQIEDERQAYNAEIAASGNTYGSNNVYNDANASFAAEKAQAAEEIQNQANRQQFSANQQALNQAGQFNQMGYGNATRALGTGYGAKTGANNALAAYYSQQIGNKYGITGAGIAATAALLAA